MEHCSYQGQAGLPLPVCLFALNVQLARSICRISEALAFSWLVGLLQLEEPIHSYISQDLTNTRGPVDFDVGRFCRSETKVQTFVARRKVAARGSGEANLAIDLYPRAESVAIAAVPVQCDGEPMQRSAAV